MSPGAAVCLYSKNKFVSCLKCINCDSVFYPECVNRLNLTIIDETAVVYMHSSQNPENKQRCWWFFVFKEDYSLPVTALFKE